jgi:hypothetical protein
MLFEFTGTATSSVLDGSAGSSSGTSSTVASGTATSVTYKNDVIVAGLVSKAGNNFSGQTNNFTEQIDVVIGGGGSATLVGGYYRRHTGGNNTTSATSSGSGDWQGVIAAFKSSSPTAVTLTSLSAVRRGGGRIQLAWYSGYEVDNLGYHVYREENGVRRRLTPVPIAGSALTVGPRVVLPAGQAYGWEDVEDSDSGAYWLESIDLDGHHTWHGPIGVTDAPADEAAPASRSLALTDYRALARALAAGSIVPATVPTYDGTPNLQTQRALADRAAVKLLVDAPGWYRVGQPDLVAAGLPGGVSPRSLRLFVDGVEQPLVVSGDGDGRFGPSDAIEFYGTGVDTPWTDRQVYWLVWGGQAGRRIRQVRPATGLRRRTASSFPFTVERRDREIFFGALQNGDAENWFGPLISGPDPAEISIDVANLAADLPGRATLEVTLQGVTKLDDNWPDHRVGISLNGTAVGQIDFDAQAQLARRFDVPLALLQEGANTIAFEARGGNLDVSLLDRVRLTYPHRYAPDGDVLWSTATGGALVTLTGFADPDIRVIDVTNPGQPVDLRPRGVTVGGVGYSVAFVAPGAGRRHLLAFTDTAVRSPAAIVRNIPSQWAATRADYLLIAHPSLLEAVAPLAASRATQGYRVATIDVTDLYDEFSYGRPTPYALRDFLRTLPARQTRFVALVGDASSDPRDYAGYGPSDLIPTLFLPMQTVALEAASDEALGDRTGDGLADNVFIGRLAVRTPEDASAVVTKILAFEATPPGRSVLLAADAADAEYDFSAMSESLAALVPSGWPINRAYADQLGVTGTHAEILSRFDDAPWLLTYIGHGSTTVWGQSASLFTASDVAGLTNPAPAIVLAMNCLNGFFTAVYPPEAGLAETLLRAAGAGAVAVWASSSLTVGEGQLEVSHRLYQRLAAGSDRTLGQALHAAKQATSDKDVRLSWILFGDSATLISPD